MEMASAFTLNVRLDNIAVITIDVPGEKMNTLKAEFASQVRAIIKQLRENKELRGVCLSPRNQTTSLLAQTST